GRGGRARVRALLGERPIHSDRFDPDVAAARARFARDVAEVLGGLPGGPAVDAAQVEQAVITAAAAAPVTAGRGEAAAGTAEVDYAEIVDDNPDRHGIYRLRDGAAQRI